MGNTSDTDQAKAVQALMGAVKALKEELRDAQEENRQLRAKIGDAACHIGDFGEVKTMRRGLLNEVLMEVCKALSRKVILPEPSDAVRG